jgi:hypothetical protein
MSIHAGLIQINVTSVVAAWDFYVGTLGFAEAPGSDKGSVLILENGAGPKILIYPVENSVTPNYPNQTGTTLVFYVDDIERTVEGWRSKGVEFIPVSWSEDETGIAGCPFGRFIAFKDPFGNIHEVLQPYGSMRMEEANIASSAPGA